MKHIYAFSKVLALALFSMISVSIAQAQEHSVAQEWNEVLLEAIRNDFARPVVHARNLWHSSVVMYDCWAAYDDEARPFFLARTTGDFYCEFEGVPAVTDVQAAQEEAMSYAMCRLLKHRFQNSPGWEETEGYIDDLMAELGYDESITSTDYVGGTPAEFGNYIAEQMITFGLQDGSNEINDYGNQYYGPVNDPVFPALPGNPDMNDPNRWQPISLEFFIDQSGNPLPTGAPEFLGPEWGNVVPFSMSEADKITYTRNGDEYHVWHDPGAPAYIDTLQQQNLENMYKWGHMMVSVWQSHNTPNDNVIWDISPGAIGNIALEDYPTQFEDYPNFYNFTEGGDIGQGHPINPVTGQPYLPQFVKRGDYARVLAEFWADGPDSETPPGHWYTILNYVNDHPQLEKRWNGQGEVLDDLEWDVKTYFVMGGAMHDAAIAAWSVKGWYDYARPISAIRFMAEKGQSSDPNLPSYHPGGMPIIPGYAELVYEGDPLAGDDNEHVGKMKIYTWKGHPYISNTETEYADVGWILAENWWPYQRPSFVTPPFAGYVSGHSTYSRTAAEVMTLMTGDNFFPGGMGIFDAPMNEFLVFEEGPSQTIELQWATYQDASDQCSLSRIWGGIHPPIDDVPGRFMGMEIGPEAYNFSMDFLYADLPKVTAIVSSDYLLNDADAGNEITITVSYDRDMDSEYSPAINFPVDDALMNTLSLQSAMWIAADTFEATFTVADAGEALPEAWIQVTGGVDLQGKSQLPALSAEPIMIDTENPTVALAMPELVVVNDAVAMNGSFEISLNFSEDLDDSVTPALSFPMEDPLANSLIWNEAMSYWADNSTYVAVFDVTDAGEELAAIDIMVQGAKDLVGNDQEVTFEMMDAFDIDTRNPELTELSVDANILSDANVGAQALSVQLSFDEAMDTNFAPVCNFPMEDPMANSLVLNTELSGWLNDMSFLAVFDLMDANEELTAIDVETVEAKDLAGNDQVMYAMADAFSIDTRNPMVAVVSPSVSVVADANVATGFELSISFDEVMDTNEIPAIAFPSDDPMANTLSLNESASYWSDDMTFVAVYVVIDDNEELDLIDVDAMSAKDAAGNDQVAYLASNVFTVDTRNPEVVLLSANTYEVTESDVATGFELVAIFDEPMDINASPEFTFPLENPNTVLTANEDDSYWVNNVTYVGAFGVTGVNANIPNVDVSFAAFTDEAGNEQVSAYYADFFDILITIIGVEELNAFEGITVYPNPAHGGSEVVVALPNQSEDLRYEVYSMDGALVAAEESASMQDQSIRIPTAGLSAGMYFIHLHDGADRAILKLQVTH